MNYKYLFILLSSWILHSCSLQRQSAISRSMFVKVGTKKSEVPSTTLKPSAEKGDLAFVEPADSVKSPLQVQAIPPTVKAPSATKKNEARKSPVVSAFKEKFLHTNFNYYAHDRASQAEEDEYVNDKSRSAFKFSLMGLIFGALNFLIFPIAGLLTIAFGNPFFIIGALALSLVFGILGLIFSILGKRIVRKYRTDKTPQETRKWRGRSALGIIGIVLSSITLGFVLLGLLIAIILMLFI